jgi:hypothetical protein
MSDHGDLPIEGTEDGLTLLDEQAKEKIRRVWHEERWWFSVIDEVGVLTDAPKPRQYWFDMKRTVHTEGVCEAVSRCRALKMPAIDGKSRERDSADLTPVMTLVSALPAWRRSPTRRIQDLNLATCNAGIYAITNILTQEQYIGSNGDLSARFNRHRTLLLRGDHHAKRLQEAWDQYGAEHFRFELLESVPDSQRLQKWARKPPVVRQGMHGPN